MSDELRTENERLRDENTTLRGLMPKLGVPCVYCGLTDISKCERGFPGCAQADDLMVADDELGKRLVKFNRELRAELDLVKREAAAMRELGVVRCLAARWESTKAWHDMPSDHPAWGGEIHVCVRDCKECYDALSSPAASDYVPREELDRVKREGEVLQSCLIHIKRLALECCEKPGVVLAAVGLSACGALSPTAASDYVSKASVRPIAEALNGGVFPCCCENEHVATCPELARRSALARARELGVLEGER